MKNPSKKTPYLIGISGESGVGKSTIAEVVSLFFGANHTTLLSTDDLHRWERSNKIWGTITHLDPEANNLELGDLHLTELYRGNFIYRSIYNHKTGCFNPPVKIVPKKVVVMEGLHAFYTDLSKSLLDLKIFVDTDEELRTHWKILRDTEERGYKYNDVLEAIEKRRRDSQKIREAQINAADTIINIRPKNKIKYLGSKHEKVSIEFSINILNDKNDISKDLFSFISNYSESLENIINVSEILGNDLIYCQNSGGNISVKVSDELMIIKSSGYRLKDLSAKEGYSLVRYSDINSNVASEEQYNIALNNSVLPNYNRPSMETGFHAALDGKYTVHLHPIYVTLLLCLENSNNIIEQLYSCFDYCYIKYYNPGYELFKKINEKKDKAVYFIENHGIIISHSDLSEIVKTLHEINCIAEKCIKNAIPDDFYYFELSFADKKVEQAYQKYYFPDWVVFSDNPTKKEIIAAHNYIECIGSKIGTLREIPPGEVTALKSMESEQYRKTK